MGNGAEDLTAGDGGSLLEGLAQKDGLVSNKTYLYTKRPHRR